MYVMLVNVCVRALFALMRGFPESVGAPQGAGEAVFGMSGYANDNDMFLTVCVCVCVCVGVFINV